MKRSAYLLLAIFLFTACDDGRTSRPSGDAAVDTATSDGAMPMMMMIPTNAPVPTMPAAQSDVLSEVFAACERLIGNFERDVSMRCNYSADTLDLATTITDMHAELISVRPLPGRGLEAFAVSPADLTLAGDAIELLPCTSSPLCAPGASCPSMNAFAVTNLVMTLDPLLLSFAEGAAYLATLAEDAGGIESVDEVELYTGLGQIYAAQAMRRPFTVIDEASAMALLTEDPIAIDAWMGATAFLLFHEIGHADLNHSLINHTAATGAEAILMGEGRTLTSEEAAALRAEVRTLKVFTESQADIYSATLLAETDYSSNGPVLLFTVAMSAYLVASGACSSAMTQEQLFDCALANDPQAAHPPLDVRATVLSRILDDGEDLSGMLELIAPE